MHVAATESLAPAESLASFTRAVDRFLANHVVADADQVLDIQDVAMVDFPAWYRSVHKEDVRVTTASVEQALRDSQFFRAESKVDGGYVGYKCVYRAGSTTALTFRSRANLRRKARPGSGPCA